jgi:hypothetical protein
MVATKLEHEFAATARHQSIGSSAIRMNAPAYGAYTAFLERQALGCRQNSFLEERDRRATVFIPNHQCPHFPALSMSNVW